MRKSLNNMTKEERRLYDNEMHRRQEKKRKERLIREAYKDIVCEVAKAVDAVGWDMTDLLLGPEEEMLEKVAEYLIKQDVFKITFGSKTGIRIKRKE